MSLRHLQRATVRRYVESTPLINTARIYCEERSTYTEWSKDATELMTLWVTERDRTGATRLDRYRPDLEDEPAYKIEYKDNGAARVWLNICILDEAEYNDVLSRARNEAWTTIESRLKWEGFRAPSKSEMSGKIDEVIPQYIADVLDTVQGGY